MFEVLVIAGGTVVESMQFMSEDAAIAYAADKHDEGFTVRIV